MFQIYFIEHTVEMQNVYDSNVLNVSHVLSKDKLTILI